MPDTAKRVGESAKARLLMLALAFAWGLNWPANKIALAELGPWTLRAAGLAAGALLMAALSAWRNGALPLPRGKAAVHVAVAGLLNVGAFAIFSLFALQDAAAARVVMLVYTMPIWTCVLARLFLGELLTPARLAALALCVAGLAVLLAPHYPLPGGLWWALATAWAWAGGTVYMKWARVPWDPMTVAVWQIAAGWVGVAAGTLILGEPWYVWPLRPATLIAWAYSGLVGVGLAYFIWFIVVERLPATTAAIGSLMIPVVGVAGSAILLGEPPTAFDLIGFALIFAAAACVLLQPRRAWAGVRSR